MTDTLADTLRALSVESGEIVDTSLVVVDTLPEVIEGELLVAQEPGLSDTIAQADMAEEIAEQLDELADRAELVPVEDATVVALSAESLNREFGMIMRGAGFQFKSQSFESADSDEARVKGVAKDARAFAAHSRKSRGDLMSLSNEGLVSRFLRADKVRLHEAKVALQAESAKLSAKLGSLNDKGVAFSHSGIAKYLTQGNKAVTNIRAGVASDSAYLDKVRTTIDGIVSKAISAANSITGSGGNVTTESLVSSVTSLSTADGALMGNYTITVTKGDSAKPKITRTVSKGKTSGTAAASAVLGGVGAGMLAFGTFGAGVGIAAAVAAGAAVGNYKAAKHAETNTSKMYSASTAADLTEAVKIALDLEKHITFKMDWDAIDTAVNAADDKLDSLEGDEKQKAKKAVGEINDALMVCIKLADVAYEQAIYDIINMASVLKAVGSHMGTAKA